MRPRSGIFCTVGGVEYPCVSYPADSHVTLYSETDENPDPELFQRTGNVWTAEVATADCERLVEVTSQIQYQHRNSSYLCQITAISPDGLVGLRYIEGHKSKAAELGFVQTDPGTWAKTVHINAAEEWGKPALHSYAERHDDLLYRDWATSQTQ